MFAKHNRTILAAVCGPLALVALQGQGYAAQPAPASTAAAPAAKGATRLPHISITTVGTGTPVVLIPGLSSPRAVWDGIVPHLAARHQVILVQVNGFGGDDPGANLQPGLLDGAVADLHAYLAGRKLSGVPVIGHSMGGLLTLMLAKAHPGDVGRGMIVDALPFIGTIFAPGATVAGIEPQARVMRDRMAASHGQAPNLAFVEATANGLALKPESRAKVTQWMLATDARVSAQAMYEDMTTDVTADLPAIKAPLTVIVPFGGRLNEDQAKAMYGAAYATAPNTTIVTVGDSAHFVMLDQPEAFAAAVAAFLGR